MKISLKYVLKKAQRANEVIIVGAGKRGKELFKALEKVDSVHVSAFFDNDVNLSGTYIQDILIEKPYNTGKDGCAYIIAVDDSGLQKELAAQLIGLGVKKDCLVIWNCYGMYEYLSSLEEKFYGEEVQDMYYRKFGKKIDWDNLATYNEKIQWMKLYGVTPMMTRLTDKYAVREWVKDQIGERYLVPLIGVWDRFDDIEIDKLPKRFVLKCTHGCEWNEIVRDKKTWNPMESRVKFQKWLETNFAFQGALQMQYRDIVPRIIGEEYLENGDGDLYDYKFWCMDGKVVFIMFLSERSSGLKMNNYDREWNLLPFTYNYPNSPKKIPRPEKLDEMIYLAERLAKGFYHVRVDLYQLNDGEIKFGEMTFTSCNGTCRWSDDEIDLKLGRMIPDAAIKGI